MKLRSFPSAFTIIIGFIFLAGLLTYVIPKGQYERVKDPVTNREKVVQGSYQRIEARNLSLFEIILSVPKGILKGGEIVILVFLVGGCIYVIEKTNALSAGVSYLTGKVKGREVFALILIGGLFALGGAAEGLQEEIIPLIPILLILTKSLGYPSLVTIGISYGCANIGSTFSPVNPFGAVIAQNIAEVPFLSGSGFRLIVFGIAISSWIFMMILYGNQNRTVKENNPQSRTPFNTRHILILLLFISSFGVLAFGMSSLGWGLNEVSAEFFVVAIIAGLLGGLGVNGTFIAYAEGFKEMTSAAMIVGLAYGISIVLQEGLIIDTIIYGLFTPLQYVSASVSACGMMLAQAFLHIAIPSYSGQAVLTIPILAPLSDLVGLSRNVCVMAFQYGAILSDQIIPTNGAMMAMIAMAGISYDQWFKFAFKRILLLMGLGIIALLTAIAIGQ